MKPDMVTIIIPALNEEVYIETVIKELAARFGDVEIIVVDDGSSDSTAAVAGKAGARVINHEKTRGYGAALRTGVEASSREYVLFCDGDGQHSVDDVARLMEACDNFDMVVGSRNHESHVPFVRRPGKYILKKFANFLAGQRIPDLNSGLRILRKDVLMKYIHLMPNGFSFSTTSTFAFLKSNRHIKYLRITVKKRVGTSTVRQWKHGPQTLMLMLRLTVLFNPLRVFLPVSGVLLLMGVVMTVANIAFFRPAVPSSAIFLGVSSIIIFMMSLVIDQASAIRREIHEQK